MVFPSVFQFSSGPPISVSKISDFGFVGRHLFRDPCGLGTGEICPGISIVVRLHQGHALEDGVGSNLARALFDLGIFEFELALVDQEPAFEAKRFDCLQGGRAALRFEVLGYELIDRRRGRSGLGLDCGLEETAKEEEWD